MSNKPLSRKELEHLRTFDTPTICNALEVFDPRFRSQGYTLDPLVCAFPKLPPMVGYAKTATMRAMRPARRDKKAEDRISAAYIDYVGAGSGPKIAVVQDLDGNQRGRGALWGEVNTTMHQALGCVGVLTNGSVRDLRMIAPEFQLLAGSVGPSHAHDHLVGFGGEVNVAGMIVADGDLVHADEHGAVVIPHELARKLPDAVALVTRREAVILKACREPGFTVDKLKKAIAKSEQVH
ncbi:MAG: RraA family protein [Burkholderiales bacterium]|nr:RraA family protein [Burkholderiales bacterium]